MKLDLEIEPVFASMAIFDARERKRLSENFYFDCNPDTTKGMLNGHIPAEDFSTLARSCVFNVSYPTADLVIIVRLEKVLQQGDVAEAAEVYLKEDKNKEKAQNNAQFFCER